MMILNPPEDAGRRLRPSWHRFKVHGKSFALEVNTLELWEGDGDLPSYTSVPDPVRPKSPVARRPGMIVLLPTLDCNCRCEYCYGNYGDQPDPACMSSETARRAIELVSNAKNLRVSFFGGEPLLAFGLVREAVGYACALAKARKTKPMFNMTTNGVLLDDEKAAWLGANGFSFIVSVDGTEELHDRARPDADGNGTWERAVRGAELLVEHGARGVALRGTFGPDEVRLLERVQALNALVRRGVGNSVSVEPLTLGEGQCSRGARGFNPRDMAAVAREYHELAVWMLDEWVAGRRPKHMQLERMIRRLLDRKVSCSTCGAGNGYWTVGVNGEVYACHRAGEDALIGALNPGLDERRDKWLDNRLINSQECAACWRRFWCGGVCRRNAQRLTGKLWTPAPVLCAIKWCWQREAVWIVSEATRLGIIDRVRETADRPVGLGPNRSCCGTEHRSVENTDCQEHSEVALRCGVSCQAECEQNATAKGTW